MPSQLYSLGLHPDSPPRSRRYSASAPHGSGCPCLIWLAARRTGQLSRRWVGRKPSKVTQALAASFSGHRAGKVSPGSCAHCTQAKRSTVQQQLEFACMSSTWGEGTAVSLTAQSTTENAEAVAAVTASAPGAGASPIPVVVPTPGTLARSPGVHCEEESFPCCNAGGCNAGGCAVYGRIKWSDSRGPLQTFTSLRVSVSSSLLFIRSA